MKEEQKHIYYVSAETVERAMKLPQTERVRDQGYDILCMTDDVDEFAVRMLGTFMEKPFQSVSDAGLDLVSDEEKTGAGGRAGGASGLFEGAQGRSGRQG